MRHLLISLVLSGLIVPARAADPVSMTPPPEVPAIAPDAENGIWGAIAIAPAEGRYGFFWGGASRQEAEENALRNCERQGAAGCDLASVFRSRSLDEQPDGSAFPYQRCGALAVPVDGATGRWAATSSNSREEAEAAAISQCGSERTCRIEEWVCT